MIRLVRCRLEIRGGFGGQLIRRHGPPLIQVPRSPFASTAPRPITSDSSSMSNVDCGADARPPLVPIRRRQSTRDTRQKVGHVFAAHVRTPWRTLLTPITPAATSRINTLSSSLLMSRGAQAAVMHEWHARPNAAANALRRLLDQPRCISKKCPPNVRTVPRRGRRLRQGCG